jgi:HSP20 family protein
MRRTLAPWTPRLPESLWDLRREVEGLFNRALDEEGGSGGSWMTEFVPRTDIAETESQYEVTAELPGFKPEEIHVELNRELLTISAERKEEKEEKGKTFHRVERQYGTFRRSVTLPNAAEAEKVMAEYKDGVLAVTVPKAEEARPTKIKVAGNNNG